MTKEKDKVQEKENDKTQEISESKPLAVEEKRGCKKTRCGITLCAIFAVAACVVCYVCEILVKKNVDSVIRSAVTQGQDEASAEINALKDEIAALKKQIELIPTFEKAETRDRDKLREKWKAWTALRSKMELDEPFKEELDKFNEMFSGDKELIALVEDLAAGVDVVSNADDGKIIGMCKNALKKIVKFKKINKRKLTEISGYVLSSRGCDGE